MCLESRGLLFEFCFNLNIVVTKLLSLSEIIVKIICQMVLKLKAIGEIIKSQMID